MDEFDDVPIGVCPKCKKRIHVVGKWCPCEDEKDAEIKHLKTIIENLDMSVASFVEANVEIDKKECKRIVTMLRELAHERLQKSYKVLEEEHRLKERYEIEYFALLNAANRIDKEE